MNPVDLAVRARVLGLNNMVTAALPRQARMCDATNAVKTATLTRHQDMQNIDIVRDPCKARRWSRAIRRRTKRSEEPARDYCVVDRERTNNSMGRTSPVEVVGTRCFRLARTSHGGGALRLRGIVCREA